MSARFCLVVLIAIVLVPVESMATTVLIRASEDAYVDSENPTTKYGNADTLRVKTENTMPEFKNQNTYIKFDLSSIPPDATIEIAYLYVFDTGAGVSFDVSVYEVTSVWREQDVTWADLPTSGTAVLDRIPGYPGSGWFNADITSLATQWHAGTTLNHGVVLRKAFFTATAGTRFFSSRDVANHEPTLVVIYDSEKMEILPEMDAFVSIDDPAEPYGASADLQIQSRGRWSYLQFSTAGVPSNATIEHVRLKMYHYNGSYNHYGFTVGACRVIDSWAESTITWANKPLDTSSPYSYEGTVGYWQFAGWITMDITYLFQQWLDGVYDNYGVVVKSPSDDGTTSSSLLGRFRSSEFATEEYRPRLEVFYSIPPPNSFTASQSVTGVSQSDAAWGDYDDDGDLDLVMCGESATGKVTETYQNHNGTLMLQSNPLPGILNPATGCLAWGDYDNDGDLDLAMAGPSDAGLISRIYKNDGHGNLTHDAGQVLTPVNYASLAWGDVDNDGDLDLYLQGNDGANPVSMVYYNDPTGTLTEGQALPDVYYGFADWADWDCDGDLDLVATGSDYTVRTTRFYENTNGVLASTGNRGLPDAIYGDVAWGDYDNDGDLDLAFAGQDLDEYDDPRGYAQIYENVSELDTLVLAWTRPDTGLVQSSCAWGDFDNDGKLDVAFCGRYGSGLFATEIYYNDNIAGATTFIQHTAATGIPGVYVGSVSWADVENDGDLDLFVTGMDNVGGRHATVFANGAGTPNTRPSPPNAFSTLKNESIGPPPGDGTLTLRWNGASDTETSYWGLNYCVQVGTSMKENDILSGTYGTPLMGNVGQTFEIEIPVSDINQPYYWRVKAIDAGLMASKWSYGQCSWGADSLIDFEDGPVEDAYVDSGAPNDTLGVTAAQMLVVGDLTGGGTGADVARAYLKFAVDPSMVVKSAKLHVYCWDVSPVTLTSMDVGVWVESSNMWDEDEMTWNTAPLWFHPWPTDIAEAKDATWSVWDVTVNVANVVGNDITFVLRAHDPPEGSDGPWAEFYSDEYTTASLRPYLEITYATAVGIDGGDGPKPKRFALDQNVPNPFNPHTRLSYTIPEGSASGLVDLSIYDVKGRLVRTLVNESQPSGTYTVEWNGRSQAGTSVASGVYFYRLRWDGNSHTRKMLLLR